MAKLESAISKSVRYSCSVNILTFVPFQTLLDYLQAQKENELSRPFEIKAVKSNSLINWNHYRTLKNQINNEIEIAKQDHYVNAFDKFSGDTRKT